MNRIILNDEFRRITRNIKYCRNYFYNADNYHNNNCINGIKLLRDNIDIIDRETILILIDYLKETNCPRVLNEGIFLLDNLIDKLKYVPPEIINIKSIKNFNILLPSIFKINKNIITKNFLIEYIKKSNNTYIDKNYENIENLINLLLQNKLDIIDNELIILLLTKYKESKIFEKIIILIDKYDIKVNLSQENIEDILYIFKSINNDSKEYISKKLLKLNIKIDKKLLDLSCKSNNLPLIKFLLDNKIEPDKETFKNIFNSNFNKENIQLVIDYIISYGYKIDYEDVLLATKYKIQINNIQNFNIKFDQKFVELCSEIGFYPKYNIKIKENIKCLENECSRDSNYNKIKELINSGIKPNKKCLQNSIKYFKTAKQFELLIDNGYDVDLDDIMYYIDTNSHKASNIFKILKILMLNYEKNLKNNNNSNISSNKEIKNSINNEISENNQNINIVNDIINDIEKDLNYNKNNIKTNNTINKEIIKETIKETNNKEINKIINKVIDKEINKENNKENIYNFINNTIIKNIKPFNEFTIKNEIKLLFRLPSIKVNFIELRKYLLKYIKLNNLINNNNHLLIKYDEKLFKILNINKNYFLNIEDIDIIILYLINL